MNFLESSSYSSRFTNKTRENRRTNDFYDVRVSTGVDFDVGLSLIREL